MEREEPKELELSLLALLDPVIERSSEGRLVLFPGNIHYRSKYSVVFLPYLIVLPGPL